MVIRHAYRSFNNTLTRLTGTGNFCEKAFVLTVKHLYLSSNIEQIEAYSLLWFDDRPSCINIQTASTQANYRLIVYGFTTIIHSLFLARNHTSPLPDLLGFGTSDS